MTRMEIGAGVMGCAMGARGDGDERICTRWTGRGAVHTNRDFRRWIVGHVSPTDRRVCKHASPSPQVTDQYALLQNL